MRNTAVDPQTRILYVAKDRTAGTVVTEALRQAGFSVQEASTGKEALAKMDENPDVLLVAVDLPDLSGFEVCRKLKQDPRRAAIPVVLFSSTFAEQAERLRALAAGADDYLMEPLEPAEFVAHIRNLLLVQRSGGASAISPREPST